MFRALFKNSFLALQDGEEAASKEAALGTSLRARSADSVVGSQKLRDDRCDDSVRLQLRRLDTLISGGQQGLQVATAEAPQEPEAQQELQAQVGVQYKPRLGLTKHVSLKNCRVASNSSVSTMAPDDTSDCDDEVASMARNFRGMRHALSSGSVCSLISELEEASFSDDAIDYSRCVTEESTVEWCLSGTDWDDKVCSPKTIPTPPKPSARASSGTVTPVKPIAARSTTDEFSHCHVPRHVNLVQEFERTRSRALPTTIMIRNIPNRYTQTQIMKELETLGFAGTFDFFYAPMDKCTRCNVGYAFVNFVRPEVAAYCMQVMENHCFRSHGRQREKHARVSVAHIQGFEANIKHYKDAAVNSVQSDGQRGPVIMPSIARSLGALFE